MQRAGYTGQGTGDMGRGQWTWAGTGDMGRGQVRLILADFCRLAVGAARLSRGCEGRVCRVLLLPGLGDVQGTHWKTGGAASQDHPVAVPALCIPNIPDGVRSPVRVLVPAQPRVPTAGPPSPAHGAQRDQVHRAGRGE